MGHTTDPGLADEAKGFIGERFDVDAGLQFLNARYYDPELGLFLQPDWFEVTSAGVGTNRYAYSGNDPVNMVDPGGNELGPPNIHREDLWEAGKDLRLQVGASCTPARCRGQLTVWGGADGSSLVASRITIETYPNRQSLSRAEAQLNAAGGLPHRDIPTAIALWAGGLLGGDEAASYAMTGSTQPGMPSTTPTTRNANNINNSLRLDRQLASQQIAGGHGFEKHVLQQGEFAGLGIRTRAQYAAHIESVLNNPSSVRYTADGRSFHLQRSTRTVVVRDRNSQDGGTAFQPREWDEYVSRLPKE